MPSPSPIQTDGPRRKLTAQQMRVADGIVRGLSYAQIGVELGRARADRRPVSEHTIRAHVGAIALLFDDVDEGDGSQPLPPRMRIYTWMKQRLWAAAHGPGDSQ